MKEKKEEKKEEEKKRKKKKRKNPTTNIASAESDFKSNACGALRQTYLFCLALTIVHHLFYKEALN